MHNREVLEATLRLRNEIIPRFAKEIGDEFEAAYAGGSENSLLYFNTLCHRMHVAGINVRYLGLVRAAVSSVILKRLILAEMVCSR